jgi:hypothetical protein
MVMSGEKQRPGYGTGRGHDVDKGYLAGARAAVPFALATAVLGVSFGVLARCGPGARRLVVNSEFRAVLRNAGEHGRVYLKRTNLYPPI